jgi:cytoskeletal protein RodZ
MGIRNLPTEGEGLSQKAEDKTPSKKESTKSTLIGCGCLLLLIILIIIIIVIASHIGNKGNTNSKKPDAYSKASATTTTVTSTPTPTPTPTPTLTPTESGAQSESDFKASSDDTTVANLVKLGSGNLYAHVHFTCVIDQFVQDSSGETVGANVVDPNDYSSVIQVQFPGDTFLSEVNKGDTLEVWGVDDGESTGTNAYGATIQEVMIFGRYMNDITSGDTF